MVHDDWPNAPTWVRNVDILKNDWSRQAGRHGWQAGFSVVAVVIAPQWSRDYPFQWSISDRMIDWFMVHMWPIRSGFQAGHQDLTPDTPVRWSLYSSPVPGFRLHIPHTNYGGRRGSPTPSSSRLWVSRAAVTLYVRYGAMRGVWSLGGLGGQRIMVAMRLRSLTG